MFSISLGILQLNIWNIAIILSANHLEKALNISTRLKQIHLFSSEFRSYISDLLLALSYH
jgi:hypothetical protein